MKRKIFYDQIYKDIRSIQEFEDDNVSERSDCLCDYFLDHEYIISQYSTFDFSKERCFDKSALDRIAKRLLPKDCYALFPVFTKGKAIAFMIKVNCCLLENYLNFRQNCELK